MRDHEWARRALRICLARCIATIVRELQLRLAMWERERERGR